MVLTGTGNIILGLLNLNAGFWDLALFGVISGLAMGLFCVAMSTLAFQNIGPTSRTRPRADPATSEFSGISGCVLADWRRGLPDASSGPVPAAPRRACLCRGGALIYMRVARLPMIQSVPSDMIDRSRTVKRISCRSSRF